MIEGKELPSIKRQVTGTTVVGNGASGLHDDVILIGDGTTSTKAGEIQVGYTLFGTTIPPSVRDSILSDPQSYAWLIRQVAAFIKQQERQSIGMNGKT